MPSASELIRKVDDNRSRKLDNKLGRNDPCWCGSGRKYKRCHMFRDSEERLPLEAIRSKADQASSFRTCLHPNASPEECGNLISAHTLQRSRVLKSIIGNDNHLMSFYPVHLDSKGKLIASRRGWKRAATFEAFCEFHDNDTFTELEKKPFQATPLQIFLVAYRAICWEYYQKVRATRAAPVFRDLVDRGVGTQFQQSAQSILKAQREGFEQGKADLVIVKCAMEDSLLSSEFSVYRMFEVLIDGPTSVVATGAITPNRTISGRSLQVLHDASKPTEWLSFGVDVSERGTSIVFLWSRNEQSPNTYMDEVLNLTDSELLAFVPQFFFAHCENTYFSESWWNSIVKKDRDFLSDLMSISNPYYYTPPYNLERRTTEWGLIHQNEISTT